MHTHPTPIVYVNELVINWHILEACNYRCKFCFAKWDKPGTREVWHSASETSRILQSLRILFDPANTDNPLYSRMRWRSIRLSIAGGEPTLLGERLVDITREARQLGFDVSLISNGSHLTQVMMQKLAPVLSVVGLSIDATDREINITIGRADRGKLLDLEGLLLAVETARTVNPDIVIKVNTVVNAANSNADFTSFIERIQPDRWKLMRMLPVVTNALEIDDAGFEGFANRHHRFDEIMCIEDNDEMTQSYVMVDPHGRFFQNAPLGEAYIYSPNILDIGADAAFRSIPFSPPKFARRYSWGDDPGGTE